MSEIRVDTISEKTSANGVSIDGLTIKDGGITATTGAIVFNEASADVDFRVESNGQANMLFVDGGNNRVHVNGTTGTRELNVSGDNTRLLLYSTNNSTGAGQLQFGDADNEQIGRIMYEHDGNQMSFHTNNAQRLLIDSSGRLLIGTTDIGYTGFGDDLTIGSASGNNGMTIRSGTSNYGTFYFSDATGTGTGTYAGKLQYNHSDNSMRIATNSVDRLFIDSAGAITMPYQPAFQVHPASQQTNVAGSAGATIVFGTERFDVNADFASNTFTAPVTGKYQMNVLLRLEDIDIDYSYFRVYLNTSNKQYEWLMDPNFTADLDYLSLGFSILVDMDASDTSTVSWEHGGGANQVDISAASMWTGYLVA